MKVNVGVSNRHVHLTEEVFKQLFGDSAEMVKVKDLIQPGQFASESLVTLKTEKSTIEKVRVLGPIRPQTQVEISKTDAYKLGINPPVRNSGDLEGSASVTLIGPNGEATIDNCCIIAARHLHVSQQKSEETGLKNGNVVSISIAGEKGAILHNVYVRSGEGHEWELHIDTDDANANLVNNGDEVEIIVND